jgi:tripartite-type tricarboxylate transporter receptor subunit TctC
MLTAATLPGRAQSVEEFYKGKSITLAIGFSAGGGYDLYARHLARHMGKYIPGRPTIVPQNMAGAGSLRAANFVYSAAPKDGTVFGTFARTTGLNPLLESGATFDGTKFTWLGSVTNDVSLCVTWHTSKANNWANFLKVPTNLGGQAPSSEPDIFANLYKNVFGAPVKLVPGYPGTNEITLAMERGEVDGLCGLSWSTIKTRHAQWLKEKKINLLVQASFKKEPAIGNVPLVMEQTKDAEKLQILKLMLAAQEMARPFAAPPGIPSDRAAALAAAFDATMKDPDYLADAKKSRIDVNPVSGADIQKLLAELYATPKDIIKKASQAIAR